jgi:hypothetical protein
MLDPVAHKSTPEGVHTRFEAVAREVTLALGALTARVNELSDTQRPPLMSVLLELQSFHLRLRRYVDQLPDDEHAGPMVELAASNALDLLTSIAAFAVRSGLVVPPAPAPAPAPVQPLEPEYARMARGNPFDFAAAFGRLHAPVPANLTAPPSTYQSAGPAHWAAPPAHPISYAQPGYYPYPPHAPVYYIAQPPWQQRPPISRDAEEADEASDDERSRSRRRRRRDEESDRYSWLRTTRNFGGLTMMGAAVIAGGMALADRTYLSRADRFIPITKSALSQDSGSTSNRGNPMPDRIPAEPDNSDWQGAKDVSARSTRPAQRVPSPEVTQVSRGSQSGDGQSLNVRVVPKVTPAPVVETAKIPPPPPPPIKKTTVASIAPAVLAPAVKPSPAPEPEPVEDAGALFVPVLSTHKDSKAARDAFVDLQKAHPALLGAQQSEVQSYGGESGTWYRLVVTPAMSKVAATEMCSRLRAVGYGRCWVKAY